MKGLLRTLPPFASDYSGAASAFFGTDALLVFLDAGCCTNTYVNVEERRWAAGDAGAVSAQLRVMDTVLGSDAAVASQVSQLLEREKPPCAVLMGSPVPALVGMDVRGVAQEASATCGIPVLGMETSGFASYDAGLALAHDGLFQLIDKADAAFDTSAYQDAVGMLGFTYFDYGSDAAVGQALRQVESAGVRVVAPFAQPDLMACVQALPTCQVNLVGAASALPFAREMKRRFGIPYVAWTPGLDLPALDGFAPFAEDPFVLMSMQTEALARSKNQRVLVVGEQIQAHARACLLRAEGAKVDVASFFYDQKAVRALSTHKLRSEADLAQLMCDGSYQMVVADPLVAHMPEAKRVESFEPWPHRAISGYLFDAEEG